MRDNFGLFCDEARRFDLTATVEFVPTRPLCTLAMTTRMIAEAGRDNAAVCIDPLHFTRTGGQPADIAALDPKLFPYTQINDGVLFPGEPNPAHFGKMPQGERRMLGKGNVDLPGLLDAMPAGLPLSVEIPISLGAGLRDVSTRPYSPAEWAKIALDDTRDFARALCSNERAAGPGVNKMYMAPGMLQDVPPLRIPRSRARCRLSRRGPAPAEVAATFRSFPSSATRRSSARSRAR